MRHIHDTVSLCDRCYRHIPARVYEDQGKIMLTKDCPEHGLQTSIVEIDPAFYHSLEYQRDIPDFNQVLFEASDRCQLSCPHCYHLPDNKVEDRPILNIIQQLEQFPRTATPMLAGAEATLRPDFVELCDAINGMKFNKFELLTNGLRFDSEEFSKDCFDAGLKMICVGLNHWTYQGEKVHAKQLRAITTAINTGYQIGYVGYTLETLDHVRDILTEIKQIHRSEINHYRIRCGAFIGRSSDQQRSYLSNLVKLVKSILGDQVKTYPGDDNPYHVMLDWNGIVLRLIQWPDVSNIDMEELAVGPWCQFYDGPITNFVHQVITRDAFKNMGLPMLDLVPEKYRYKEVNVSSRNVIPIKRII
jgi:hypothetical protein